jgi:hypothetical protein
MATAIGELSAILTATQKRKKSLFVMGHINHTIKQRLQV